MIQEIITGSVFCFFFNISFHYPDTVKKKREAFLWQIFPLAQRVCYCSGGLKTQFPLVEKFGGQCEQGLMRAVVVDQLSHL